MKRRGGPFCSTPRPRCGCTATGLGLIPTRTCAWRRRRSASGGWSTRRSSYWAYSSMTATGTNWRSGRSTKSRISGGTSLSTTIRSTSPGLMRGWPNTPGRIYYEAVHGPDAADILEYRRWQAVVDGLISREEDAALAQPVTAFADGRIYEGIVYGKGALFFSAIRRTLGERAFKQFLQNYSGRLSVQDHNARGYADGVARGRPGGRGRAVQRLDRAAGEPAAATCSAPDRVSTARPQESATGTQAS